MSTITESLFGPSNRRRCVKGRASYIDSVDNFITIEDTKFDDFNCNESSNDFSFPDSVEPDEIDDEPVTIDLSDFLKENPLLTESAQENAVDSSAALSDCHSQFRVTNSFMDTNPIIESTTLNDNIPSENKISVDLPNSNSFCDVSNSVSDTDSASFQAENVVTSDKLTKAKDTYFSSPMKSPKKYVKPKSPLGFSNPLRKYKNFSKMKDFIKNNIKEFGKYPIVKCEKLDIENFVKKNNIKVSNWPLSHVKTLKRNNVNLEKGNNKKKVYSRPISKTPKAFQPISFNKSISKCNNPINKSSSILVSPDTLQPKVAAAESWKLENKIVPRIVSNIIDNSSNCPTSVPHSVIKQSIIGNERIIRILSSNLASTQHPNNFTIQNCKLPIVTSVNRLNDKSKTYQLISPKITSSITSKFINTVTSIRPKPVTEVVTSSTNSNNFTVIEPYKEDPTSPIKPKPILSVPVEILPQGTTSNNLPLIKTNLGMFQNKSPIQSKDLNVGITNRKSPVKSSKSIKSVFLNDIIEQVTKPIRQEAEIISSDSVQCESNISVTSTSEVELNIEDKLDNSFNETVVDSPSNSAALIVDAMKNAFKVQVKKYPKAKPNTIKVEKQQSNMTDKSQAACQAYNSTLNDILFGFTGIDFTEDLTSKTCDSNLNDDFDSLYVSNSKLEQPLHLSKESEQSSPKTNKVISKYKYKRKDRNLMSPQGSDTVSASEGEVEDENMPQKVSPDLICNENESMTKKYCKSEFIKKHNQIGGFDSLASTVYLEESSITPCIAENKDSLVNKELHFSPKRIHKSVTNFIPNATDNVKKKSDVFKANRSETTENILKPRNKIPRTRQQSSSILKKSETVQKSPQKMLNKTNSEISKGNLREINQRKSNTTSVSRGKRRVTYLQSRFKTKRKNMSAAKCIKKKRKTSRPVDIISEIKAITGGNLSIREKERTEKIAKEKSLDSDTMNLEKTFETESSKKLLKRRKNTKSLYKNKKNKSKTLKVLFKKNSNQNSCIKTPLSTYDHTLFQSINTNTELENNSLHSTFREGRSGKMGTPNEDGFVHDTDAPLHDQKQEDSESENGHVRKQDLSCKPLDSTCPKISAICVESSTPASISEMTSEVLTQQPVSTNLDLLGESEIIDSSPTNTAKENLNDVPVATDLQNIDNQSNLSEIENGALKSVEDKVKSTIGNDDTCNSNSISTIVKEETDSSKLSSTDGPSEITDTFSANDKECEEKIDLKDGFHCNNDVAIDSSDKATISSTSGDENQCNKEDISLKQTEESCNEKGMCVEDDKMLLVKCSHENDKILDEQVNLNEKDEIIDQEVNLNKKDKSESYDSSSVEANNFADSNNSIDLVKEKCLDTCAEKANDNTVEAVIECKQKNIGSYADNVSNSFETNNELNDVEESTATDETSHSNTDKTESELTEVSSKISAHENVSKPTDIKTPKIKSCPKVKISVAKLTKKSSGQNSSKRWYISERKSSTETDQLSVLDSALQRESVEHDTESKHSNRKRKSGKGYISDKKSIDSVQPTLTDNSEQSSSVEVPTDGKEISCNSKNFHNDNQSSELGSTSLNDDSITHSERLSSIPVLIKEEPVDIVENKDDEFTNISSINVKPESEISTDSTKQAKKSRKSSKRLSSHFLTEPETITELTSPVKVEVEDVQEPSTKKAKKASTPVSSPVTSKYRSKIYSPEAVAIPFTLGWMRELVHRSTEGKVGKKQSDVYYFSPEGTKLRSMPDILNYLTKNNVADVTAANFTFAKECIYREPFEVERSAKQKSVLVTPSNKKSANASQSTPSPAAVLKKSKKKSVTSEKDKTTPSETEKSTPSEAEKSTPSAAEKSTPSKKRKTTPSVEEKSVEKEKFIPRKASTPKKQIQLKKRKSESDLSPGFDLDKNLESSSLEIKSSTPKKSSDNSKDRPSRKVSKKVPFDNSLKEKSPSKKNKHATPSSTPNSDISSSPKVRKLLLEKSIHDTQNIDDQSLEDDIAVDRSPEKPRFTSKKPLKVKFPFHKSGLFLQTPCTFHCPVSNIQEPKIQCGVCLCLFHPSCIPVFPKGVQFVCKPCASEKLAWFEELKKSSSNELCLSDESESLNLPQDLNLSLLIPTVELHTFTDTLISRDFSTVPPITRKPLFMLPSELSQPSNVTSGYSYSDYRQTSVSSATPLLLSHLTRSNTTLSSNTGHMPATPKDPYCNKSSIGPSTVPATPKTVLPIGMRIPLSAANTNTFNGRLLIRKIPEASFPIRSPSPQSQLSVVPSSLSSNNTVQFPVRNFSPDLAKVYASSKNYSRIQTSTVNLNNSSSGNIYNIIKIAPSYQPAGNQMRRIISPPQTFDVNKLLKFYECLNLIFKKLNVYGLLKASQVSPSWKEIASKEHLWKNVSFRRLRITDWEKCCACLLKHGTKCLDLCDIILEDTEDPWKNFKAVIKKLSGIRELMLDKVPPPLLNFISSNMPQLLKLECFLSQVFTEPEIWTIPSELELSSLACLHRLRTLKIGSFSEIILRDGPQFVMPYLPNLRHLSLTGFSFHSVKNLNVLAQQTELISLELGDCSHVEPEIYEFLASLTKIKNLRLENGGQVEDTKLPLALLKMEKLEQLELMNYKIPLTLAESLKQLMELIRVNVWPDNTEQSPLINRNLFQAISNCKRLKYICWGIIVEGDSIPEVLEMQNLNEDEDTSNEIKFEELFHKLIGLFSDCRVEVRCVPRSTWKEFCSARK